MLHYTGCRGWETQQNSDPSTIFVCILYYWLGVLRRLVILRRLTCKFTHEESKTKRLWCQTRVIAVYGEEKQVRVSYINLWMIPSLYCISHYCKVIKCLHLLCLHLLYAMYMTHSSTQRWNVHQEKNLSVKIIYIQSQAPSISRPPQDSVLQQQDAALIESRGIIFL